MTDATPSLPVYTFTDAQMVDIRRFCGYPARGTANNMFNSNLFFTWFEELQYRAMNLSPAEGAIVANEYLVQINGARRDIFNARANQTALASGSVTFRDNEMEIRRGEYERLCYELCNFFGVGPGPNFGVGGGAGLYAV